MRPHAPTCAGLVELPRKLAAARELHALGIRPPDLQPVSLAAGEPSYVGGETPRSLKVGVSKVTPSDSPRLSKNPPKNSPKKFSNLNPRL